MNKIKREICRALLAMGMATGGVLLGGNAIAQKAATSPAVDLAGYGQILGQTDSSNSYNRYLGIRFAKPPVGDLRWRAPQPLIANDSGQSIQPTPYEFGNACPQIGIPSLQYTGSEDCLFLNVFQPVSRNSNLTQAKLPVMVFFYGGGGLFGSADQKFPIKDKGSLALYEPAGLVTRGVVVVTLNYRLGMLGYMAHSDLSDAQGRSGNYAHLDGIAALKWVRKNIEQFGGDPENVTIFGESQGAAAVISLMASPPAQGLFRKVIAQSYPEYYKTPDQQAANKEGGEYVFWRYQQIFQPCLLRFGSDLGNCLRKDVSAQSLVEQLVLPLPFVPVIDGLNFTKGPKDTVASGAASKISLMIGVNNKELGNFTGVAQVATDLVFTCPALQMAKGHGGTVYGYYFDEPSPTGFTAMPLPGATHAAELPYVFLTDADRKNSLNFSDAQIRLANRMQTMWTNFAKTGSPASDAIPWKTFSNESPKVMYLNSQGVAEVPIDKRCG